MRRAFMERAIEVARCGMVGEQGGPFGAVIVQGDIIVAEASNCVTSGRDPTAHAEIQAIRGACAKLGRHSLAGCEIYSSCEPCPMCLGAIYWARLDGLYFAATRDDAAAIGFDDAFLYEELTRGPQVRQLRSVQGLRDEALLVMQEWENMSDDRRY